MAHTISYNKMHYSKTYWHRRVGKKDKGTIEFVIPITNLAIWIYLD